MRFQPPSLRFHVFTVWWWALSTIHALFCLFLRVKVVQVPICRTVLDLALRYNIGHKSQLTCLKGKKFARNLPCLYLLFIAIPVELHFSIV